MDSEEFRRPAQEVVDLEHVAAVWQQMRDEAERRG